MLFHSADVLLGHQMSKSGLLIWSFFFLVAVGSSHAAFAQKPNEIFEGILDLLDQAQKLKKEQTLEQREEEEGPQGQEPTYSVDGIGIGELVDLKKNYSCKSSEQFSGFDWCSATSRVRSARGSFEQKTTLLRSIDGRAYYINRFITPAVFAPNEVDRDIERLTQRFGAKPTILLMPKRAGLPQGIIATWGDLKLKALDNAGREALIEGQSPKQGILVDFLNDFTSSAKERLPIYFLKGGAGYVWIATPSNNGRGKLRFLAADPSALDTSPPIQAVNEESSESDRNGGGNPQSTVQEDTIAPQLDSDGQQAENSREVERKKIAEENRLTAEQAARQAPAEWIKNSTQQNATVSPPSDLTASDEKAVEREEQEPSVEQAIALATARIRQEEDEAANQRRQQFSLDQARWRERMEADTERRRKLGERSASVDDLRRYDIEQREFIARSLSQREQRWQATEEALALQVEQKVADEAARIRRDAAEKERFEQERILEQQLADQRKKEAEAAAQKLEEERKQREIAEEEARERQMKALKLEEAEREAQSVREAEERTRLELQQQQQLADQRKKEAAKKVQELEAFTNAVKVAQARGLEYAASSGTSWSTSSTQNELTDKVQTTATSVQANDTGAVAEVTGRCIEPGKLEFTALVIDRKGEPTVTIADVNTGELGGFIAQQRVNDAPVRSIILTNASFENQISLAKVYFPIDRIDAVKKAPAELQVFEEFQSLLADSIYGSGILAGQTTWRILTDINTDKGRLLVKVPLYDPSVRQLALSCGAPRLSSDSDSLPSLAPQSVSTIFGAFKSWMLVPLGLISFVVFIGFLARRGERSSISSIGTNESSNVPGKEQGVFVDDAVSASGELKEIISDGTGMRAAIREVFSKYGSIEGRASRSEFWYFALFASSLTIPVVILDHFLGTNFIIENQGEAESMGYGWLTLAFIIIPLAIPSITVAVRRLHDINRSGWWVMANLIPIIGTLLLIYFYASPGNSDANTFGAAPRRFTRGG